MHKKQHTTTTTIYGHYTAGTSSQEMENFVGANFYCLHALDDGNRHIQIREKTLEFS